METLTNHQRMEVARVVTSIYLKSEKITDLEIVSFETVSHNDEMIKVILFDTSKMRFDQRYVTIQEWSDTVIMNEMCYTLSAMLKYI